MSRLSLQCIWRAKQRLGHVVTLIQWPLELVFYMDRIFSTGEDACRHNSGDGGPSPSLRPNFNKICLPQRVGFHEHSGA